MLIHLLCQHGSILHGVPQQESAAKACTEGGLRLCDALLCASNLHMRDNRQSAMALALDGSAEAWSGCSACTLLQAVNASLCFAGYIQLCFRASTSAESLLAPYLRPYSMLDGWFDCNEILQKNWFGSS